MKRPKEKNGRFIRGYHYSPETEFKKGILPHNNGKTKENYEPLRIAGEKGGKTRKELYKERKLKPPIPKGFTFERIYGKEKTKKIREKRLITSKLKYINNLKKDSEEIKRLYEIGKSIKEIKKLTGHCHNYIKERLEYMNIKIKKPSFYRQGKKPYNRLNLNIKKIKELYSKGKLVNEIAKIFNCSQTAIFTRLEEANVPLRKKQYLKELDDNLILDLYINKKKFTPEIAKIFGCSYGTILRKLNEMGIKERLSKKRDFDKYKEKIISLYKKGYNSDMIGLIYGVSGSLILKRLKEWNIKIRKPAFHSKPSYFLYSEDNHQLRSSHEIEIDNWLFRNRVAHIPNKKIGYGLYRTDFYIPDANIWIEYFGLMDIKTYKEKTKKKVEIYKQLGLNLLPLFPFDNISQKLNFLLKYSQNQTKLTDFENK